jgi:hypothetical protein
LDWAQAEIIRTAEPNSITAQHHGYDHLGITHRRQLRMVSAYKIEVIDEMIPVGNKPNEHAFWLHWLLPDLPWKLKENLLLLHLGQSKDEIQVKIDCEINGKSAVANEIQIVREGKNLTGSGIVPVILGWHSLLYGEKKPALSFRVCIRSKESVRFTTQFLFQ